MDITDSWETRFHGVPFVMKFIAPKKPDGTVDANTMLRTLEAMSASRESARKVFAEKPIGISIFAKTQGLSHIQAAYVIGSDPELHSVCAVVGKQPYEAARSLIQQDSTVVLDPSSATTLFVTGMHERMDKLPTRCIVPQSTLFSIQEEISRVTYGRIPAGYTYTVNGRVRFEEHDEDAYRRYRERLNAFVRWIENTAEVRGGSSAASLSKEDRDRYEEQFGLAYAESACLAKAEGALHWSDDVAVSVILDNEQEVPTIWTQVFFDAVRIFNLTTDDDSKHLVIQLLHLGVEPTYWNADVVVAVGKACEWRLDQRPLKTIIRFFDNA
jgi:hypothetical protein